MMSYLFLFETLLFDIFAFCVAASMQQLRLRTTRESQPFQRLESSAIGRFEVRVTEHARQLYGASFISK